MKYSLDAKQIYAVITLTLLVIVLSYPTAFVVHHGWQPAAWPAALQDVDAVAWFKGLFKWGLNVLQIVLAYWHMGRGEAPAFSGGGAAEIKVIAGLFIFFCSTILLSGKIQSIRDRSGIYGDAQWSSADVVARLTKGLEIGIDPVTGKAVRIQVEGNLLTIAPPRTGKTGGFIIPNLAFPEIGAWAGPAVVIDPKGDAHRALKRRRVSMGRVVRCLDPLGLSGGNDRWNPLLHVDPSNILYLQSMALALLPPAKDVSDASYFQSRASDLIVAAILGTIRNGKADAVGAAELLMDPDRLLAALENAIDHPSLAAASILEMDSKSRDSITSTAQQATQWLRDERMQRIVQHHTFDLSDLAQGHVDLFIVLPAGDEKKILAPYVRWLLADLFASVRNHRPAERIIAFIDEAFVLGRFDAILGGVGELPGYGLSLWTFWQSRSQLVETYNQNGADTLIATAEMTNLFNIPAALPDDNEHWSKAIGTFTGIKTTTTTDVKTGKVSETKAAEPLRLAPPSDIRKILQRSQVVFLNSPSHPPHPLKLNKTIADQDLRFNGLVDFQAPVGKTR